MKKAIISKTNKQLLLGSRIWDLNDNTKNKNTNYYNYPNTLYKLIQRNRQDTTTTTKQSTLLLPTPVAIRQ